MLAVLARLQKIAEEEKRSIYIVGGFVRDSLAGKKSRDVDMAVTEEAAQFAKKVAGRLNAAYEMLDSTSQYSKIRLQAEDSQPLELDFSLLRGQDILEDLKIRDFTVNAMAVRLDDYLANEDWQAKVIDPCGGREDLAAGLLRITGRQSLIDDPVRLVRAPRFLQKLNLTMDKESKDVIRDSAHLLSHAYKVKVAGELFLLLSLPDTAKGIRFLHRELSVLGEIYPPLAQMAQVEESSCGDILTHGLQTCECLEEIIGAKSELCGEIEARLQHHLNGVVDENRKRLAYLKLACIIHDIGMLDAPQGAKRLASFSHEQAAEVYVEGLSRQLRLNAKEQQYLTVLVRNHSRPLFLEKEESASSYRFFKQFGDIVPELLLLKTAAASTRGQCSKQWLAEMLKEYFDGRYDELPEPIISASEIMEFFNLPPSRYVGSFLEEVYAAQLSGKVRTKDEALSLTSVLLEKRGGSR